MTTSTSVPDRWVAAALAAFLATAKRGVDAFTDVALLRSLEEACRLLGVPETEFDECAQLFGYYYFRPWDCYLGQKQLEKAKRLVDSSGAG